MKTSELTGPALDWAVAKALGKLPATYDDWAQTWPHFSTNWAQGGPIIERENITWDGQAATLCRHVNGKYPKWSEYGPTPLVAAMRCYVASKLGDEVTIPKELS
jgi:hypothetical protein